MATPFAKLPLASVALLGCALLAGCGENKDAAAAEDIRPVRTLVATPSTEGEAVSLTGQIRARTEKNLAFRLDGRMIARPAVVGQVLKLNEPIAELDSQPQRDALRAAQARLTAAQAVAVEAANNLERQRKLVQDGWANRVQFDAADRGSRSAAADVRAAESQLHTAEDQLGYTHLAADVPGVVTATGAEAGEVVRAGQMIVTVAQDDGIDAVFDVPASFMRQIPADAVINVALTDDSAVKATGRVREVAPQADPVTRSFRVKVGLDSPPEELRLGATVTGRARFQAAKGIELPATALTAAEGKPAVWVVDATSQQVTLKPVTLLQQGASTVVVSGGLQAGERVVTAGVHALHPGQKVRVEGVAP